MRVVSNTSPLLNLALIDRLDILRVQHPTIWIPPAVLKELRVDEALPGTSALREALAEGWLNVTTVTNTTLVTVFRRSLDHGEAEALALALQLRAELLLLDERDARQVARSLALPITGVVGILLRAKKDGHILALRPVLEALRTQAGFYIAPTLWDAVLCNVGEM